MSKKVYVIRGYKPATEAYGPQDSDVLGYATSKKRVEKLIRDFREEYIPKGLDYGWWDAIHWKYKRDFEAFLKGEPGMVKKYGEETLRKDWEKLGRGTWGKPIYDFFDYEEVEEIGDELPKCRYSRSV